MRQLRSIEQWLQQEKQVICTYQRHSLRELPRLEVRRDGSVVITITLLARDRFKLASREKALEVSSLDELKSTAEHLLAG
jgi:hypothetical protein